MASDYVAIEHSDELNKDPKFRENHEFSHTEKIESSTGEFRVLLIYRKKKSYISVVESPSTSLRLDGKISAHIKENIEYYRTLEPYWDIFVETVGPRKGKLFISPEKYDLIQKRLGQKYLPCNVQEDFFWNKIIPSEEKYRMNGFLMVSSEYRSYLMDARMNVVKWDANTDETSTKNYHHLGEDILECLSGTYSTKKTYETWKELERVVKTKWFFYPANHVILKTPIDNAYNLWHDQKGIFIDGQKFIMPNGMTFNEWKRTNFNGKKHASRPTLKRHHRPSCQTGITRPTRTRKDIHPHDPVSDTPIRNVPNHARFSTKDMSPIQRKNPST
jgi:hypothetical protein